MCVCMCVCTLVAVRREGVSINNLIIQKLSEGHRGIMEVEYCIPLVA